MHNRVSPVLAGVLITAMALGPALGCEGLSAGPRGAVSEVVDGDTVVVDSGLQVRLIGMQAPKLPLGRAGFVPWPLAEEARDFVVELVAGRQVELRYGGQRIDRNGRALGHLYVVDTGQWVQQAVLAAGYARVYSFADNRMCLDELFAAERQARLRRAGIWALDWYAPRNGNRPDDLLPLEGRYELVEGRVLAADKAGSRVYLNFGRIWRDDFTVVIDPPAQRLFAEAGLDPLSLASQFIRVRGWIEINDGPRIEVTHPEQIEILAAL